MKLAYLPTEYYKAPLSEAEKGVEGFKAETKALGAGGLGLVAQGLQKIIPDAIEPEFLQTGKEWALQKNAEITAAQQQNERIQPRIQRVEDIQSFADAKDWAMYQGTKGLLNVATMAVPALLGGGIGALAARGAVKEGVKKYAAAKVGERIGSQLVTEAGKKTAQQAVGKATARGAAIGGIAGGAGSSFMLEGGESFGSLVNQEKVSPEEAFLPAFTVGGVNAALDILPGVIAAKYLGKTAKEIRDGVKGQILKDTALATKAVHIAKTMGKAAAGGVAADGVTEGLQELVQIAGERWATEQKIFDQLSPEQRSRVLNAAAAGALTGGLPGTASGGIRGTAEAVRAQAPVEEQAAAPDTQTPAAPVVQPPSSTQAPAAQPPITQPPISTQAAPSVVQPPAASSATATPPASAQPPLGQPPVLVAPPVVPPTTAAPPEQPSVIAQPPLGQPPVLVAPPVIPPPPQSEVVPPQQEAPVITPPITEILDAQQDAQAGTPDANVLGSEVAQASQSGMPAIEGSEGVQQQGSEETQLEAEVALAGIAQANPEQAQEDVIAAAITGFEETALIVAKVPPEYGVTEALQEGVGFFDWLPETKAAFKQAVEQTTPEEVTDPVLKELVGKLTPPAEVVAPEQEVMAAAPAPLVPDTEITFDEEPVSDLPSGFSKTQDSYTPGLVSINLPGPIKGSSVLTGIPEEEAANITQKVQEYYDSQLSSADFETEIAKVQKPVWTSLGQSIRKKVGAETVYIDKVPETGEYRVLQTLATGALPGVEDNYESQQAAAQAIDTYLDKYSVPVDENVSAYVVEGLNGWKVKPLHKHGAGAPFALNNIVFESPDAAVATTKDWIAQGKPKAEVTDTIWAGDGSYPSKIEIAGATYTGTIAEATYTLKKGKQVVAEYPLLSAPSSKKIADKALVDFLATGGLPESVKFQQTPNGITPQIEAAPQAALPTFETENEAKTWVKESLLTVANTQVAVVPGKDAQPAIVDVFGTVPGLNQVPVADKAEAQALLVAYQEKGSPEIKWDSGKAALGQSQLETKAAAGKWFVEKNGVKVAEASSETAAQANAVKDWLVTGDVAWSKVQGLNAAEAGTFQGNQVAYISTVQPGKAILTAAGDVIGEYPTAQAAKQAWAKVADEGFVQQGDKKFIVIPESETEFSYLDVDTLEVGTGELTAPLQQGMTPLAAMKEQVASPAASGLAWQFTDPGAALGNASAETPQGKYTIDWDDGSGEFTLSFLPKNDQGEYNHQGLVYIPGGSPFNQPGVYSSEQAAMDAAKQHYENELEAAPVPQQAAAAPAAQPSPANQTQFSWVPNTIGTSPSLTAAMPTGQYLILQDDQTGNFALDFTPLASDGSYDYAASAPIGPGTYLSEQDAINAAIAHYGQGVAGVATPTPPPTINWVQDSFLESKKAYVPGVGRLTLYPTDGGEWYLTVVPYKADGVTLDWSNEAIYPSLGTNYSSEAEAIAKAEELVAQSIGSVGAASPINWALDPNLGLEAATTPGVGQAVLMKLSSTEWFFSFTPYKADGQTLDLDSTVDSPIYTTKAEAKSVAETYLAPSDSTSSTANPSPTLPPETVANLTQKFDTGLISKDELLKLLNVTIAAGDSKVPSKLQGMLQIGANPGGFNKSGLFLDAKGNQWYVKQVPSTAHGKSEALAADLYAAAGVPVVRYSPIKLDASIGTKAFTNEPGLVSEYIPNLQKGQTALTAANVAEVKENFVFDAWLANWDVVGVNEGAWGNMQVKDGKAIRLDFGGALRYRGAGSEKGSAFGPDVNELETLRDPAIAPTAAEVFKHVTTADIKAGAKRLAQITDAKIDYLVQKYFPNDAQLATLLKQRRDYILNKYNIPLTTQTSSIEQEAAAAKLIEALADHEKFATEIVQQQLVDFQNAYGNAALEATLQLAANGVQEKSQPTLVHWLETMYPPEYWETANPFASVWADVKENVDSAGKLTASPKNRYGVLVVNPQTGKVLLRRVANDYLGYIWDFAGGGPNQGEHVAQGAKRETMEEVGLDTTLIGILPTPFTKGSNDTSPPRLYYVGVPKGPQLAWENETTDTVWVTYAQAKALLSYNKGGAAVGGTPRSLRQLDALYSRGEYKNGFDYKGSVQGTEKYFLTQLAQDFPMIASQMQLSATEVAAGETLTSKWRRFPGDPQGYTRDQRLRVAIAMQLRHKYPTESAAKLHTMLQQEFKKRKNTFKARTGFSLAQIKGPGAVLTTGTPVVVQVYIGTRSAEGFIGGVVNPAAMGTGVGSRDTAHAVFASNNYEKAKNWAAGKGPVYTMYLHYKNPLVIDNTGSFSPYTFTQKIKQAKQDGYDGVIFKKTQDSQGQETQFTFWNPSTPITNELLNVGFTGQKIYNSQKQKLVQEGMSLEEAGTVLEEYFGGILESGKLTLHTSEGTPGLKGQYVSGQMHIWLNEIANAADLVGTVVHEASHASIEAVFGQALPKYYTDLVSSTSETAKAALAQTAYALAQQFGIKNNLANATGLELEMEVSRVRNLAAQMAPEVVVQEDFANYMELASTRPVEGLFQRLLNAIKAWWVQTGAGQFLKEMGFGVKMTDGLAAALGPVLVRKAYENNTAKQGEFFSTVWHLTKHQWPAEAKFPHGRPRLDKIQLKENTWHYYGWGFHVGRSEQTKEYYKNHWNATMEYTLDIPEDVLAKTLYWDRPLVEQPGLVQDLLRSPAEGFLLARAWAKAIDMNAEFPYYHPLLNQNTKGYGGALYKAVRQILVPDAVEHVPVLHAQKKVSEFLQSVGIVGSQYEDTRVGTPPGTYNTVIWDQAALDRVAIAAINGEMTGESLPGLNTKGLVYESRADSNTKLSREDFAKQISAALGQRWLTRAEASGLMHIHESANPSGASATWDGKEIHVWLGSFPEGENAVGVVLHETTHAKLEAILGKAFGKYHQDFLELVKSGNKLAVNAWIDATTGTAQALGIPVNESADMLTEVRRLEKLIKEHPLGNRVLQQEHLAYFVQKAAQEPSPLFRRIVNAIKAWWARTRIGQALKERGLGFELTDGMAVALAMASARQALTRQQYETIRTAGMAGAAQERTSLENIAAQLPFNTFGGINADPFRQPPLTAGQHISLVTKAASGLRGRLRLDAQNQAFRQTGWYWGPDGKLRFEIDDSQARLKMGVGELAQFNATNPGRIGDVLEHKLLFEAYPHLKNVEFRINPQLPRGDARLLPRRNGALMEFSVMTEDETLNALIHELQHGIQDFEGMASGANFQPTLEEEALLANSPDRTMEITRQINDRYHRSAGEAEARNAEYRREWTAEARRGFPPFESVDVSDDDVIVTVDWGGMTYRVPSRQIQSQPPSVLESRPGLFQSAKDTLFGLGTQPGTLEKAKWDYVDYFAMMEAQDKEVYDEYLLMKTKKTAQQEELNRRFVRPFVDMIQKAGWTVKDVGDALAARHVILDKVNENNAERISKQVLLEELAKPKDRLSKQDRTAARKAVKEIEAGHVPEVAGDYYGNWVDAQLAPKEKRQEMLKALEFFLTRELPVSGTKVVQRKWEEYKDHSSGYSTGLGTNDQDMRVAADVLAPFENDPRFQAIAAKFDELNKWALDVRQDGGLITADERTRLEEDKEYYAPLRREDFEYEAELLDLFRAGGRGGKGLKTRVGSFDPMEPAHVLQNAVAAADAAIAAAQRNLANNFLYEKIAANKLGWRPWFTVVEDKEIHAHDSNGFARDVQTSLVDPEDITLIRDGKRLILETNEQNERAMNFARAVNNLDEQTLSGPMKLFGLVNRWIRFVNISASPAFLLANSIRDPATAGLNLQGTAQAQGLVGEVFKTYKTSWKALRLVFMKGVRESTDPEEQKLIRMVEAWEAAGGRISFIEALKQMDQSSRSLEGRVDWENKTQWLNYGKAALEWIENANIMIENVMRLSAFDTLVRNGVSEKDAARISQDITTNFARKGFKSQALSTWWLFFNATVQGNYQVLKNVLGSRKLQGIVAGTIMLSFMIDLLGRAMSDDEDDDGRSDWDSIPAHDKERNIHLPFQINGTYVKIPSPWVYNIFWRMGQMFGETASGVNKPQDAMLDLFGMTVTAMSPIQAGTPAQWLAPTALDPLVQVWENKDFAGNPLGPTAFPGVPSARSELAWDSTPEKFKWIARGLNEATGGTVTEGGLVDLAPSTYKLLTDTVMGSGGRFLMQVFDLAGAPLSEDELRLKDVPVVRQFFTDPADPIKAQLYHERVSRIFAADKAVKMYEERGERFRAQQVREERAAELRMLGFAKDSESQLRSLRKRMRLAEGRGDVEMVTRYRDSIDRLRIRFNKAYAERVG